MHNFPHGFRIGYILWCNLKYSHSHMISSIITCKCLIKNLYVFILWSVSLQIFIPPWPLSHSYSHQMKLHIHFSLIAMLLFQNLQKKSSWSKLHKKICCHATWNFKTLHFRSFSNISSTSTSEIPKADCTILNSTELARCSTALCSYQI